jgi:hypothetical protein
LSLSNPTNALLGAPANAVLNIVDDDPAPSVQFSSAIYAGSENGGAVNITVMLSSASGNSASVEYAVSDGTATAGSDYTVVSGVLTFAPGETNKSFTAPILDDTLYEVNETVNLTLRNPVSMTIGAPGAAQLTIIDNDSAPSVRFSSATYTTTEMAIAAEITAVLSAASGITVTVNYITSDGTAVAGTDYTASNGQLIFAPGATSASFSVSITNNPLDPNDKTVNLTLSNADKATLGFPIKATLVIMDASEKTYLPLIVR